MKILQKSGFTLAEVLITLGIIGVIAAMTLPVVINYYINKQTVSQLKKVYSMLSQATISAEAAHGSWNEWNMQDSSCGSMNTVVSYYKPYFKILSDCAQKKGCWANGTITGLSGTTNRLNEFSGNFGCDKYSLSLNDGTFIVFDIYEDLTVLGIANDFPANTNTTMAFFVDLNGKRKPNQVGKDIFAFALNKKGIVPAGINNNSENCSKSIKTYNSGIDCAAKVLQEEDIKY